MEVDGLALMSGPATRERPSSAFVEHIHRPTRPPEVADGLNIRSPIQAAHARRGIADAFLSRRRRDNGILRCISPDILVTGLFPLHA